MRKTLKPQEFTSIDDFLSLPPFAFFLCCAIRARGLGPARVKFTEVARLRLHVFVRVLVSALCAE